MLRARTRTADHSATRQGCTETRRDTRNSGQEECTERQGQRQDGRSERTENGTEARRDMADDWDDRGCCWDGNRWGYTAAGVALGAAVNYAAGTAAS